MKIRKIQILGMLTGLLIACNMAISNGQPTEKIDSNLLKRQLESFESYLDSSEGYLKTSTERFNANKSCEAIADSLISALGNKDISSIKQEGFLERNERSDAYAMRRSSYADRFHKIELRTGKVENDIDDLVRRFTRSCPEWANYFQIWRRIAAELRKDPNNAEAKLKKMMTDTHAVINGGGGAKEAGKDLENTDRDNGPGSTATDPWGNTHTGGILGPGGKTCYDDGWCYDPATKQWYNPEGKPVGPDGKPKGLGSTTTDPWGNTHTKGIVGPDGKICYEDGWCYDPATKQWYNPEGKPVGPDGKPKGPGSTTTDPWGNTHTKGIVGPGGKICYDDGWCYDPATKQWYNPEGKPVGPDGKPVVSNDAPNRNTTVDNEFDEREFLDDNGQPTKGKVRAQYQGRIGEGKLDREDVRRADGGAEKIEWGFVIKQSEGDKSGDGYKVSFELVNSGKPKNAPFTVKAWTGPDGKVETKDRQISFVFPKSGEYVVKVEGQTKHMSPFVISTKVNF